MNEPLPYDRPLFGRVVVDRTPNGIRLTYPPRQLSTFWKEYLVGGLLAIPLLVCGGFLLAAPKEAQNDPGLIGVFCFYMVMYPGAGAFLVLMTLNRAKTSVRLSVEGDTLTYLRTTLFGMTHRQWQRADIVTIRVWNARLRVADPSGEHALYNDPNVQELRWVAAVLRQATGLDRPEPATADEISVSYTDAGHPEPVPAFLRSAPGLLVLRHGLGEDRPWRFVPGAGIETAGAWNSMSEGSVRLAAEDIVCRIDEEGETYMQISPTGTRLAFTIWCDDPAALPRALERFWGATGDEDGQGPTTAIREPPR